ncbi:MAG: hypothetical protein K6G26_06940, partial [Lachnospiraceae bacterium]|nr:hypothetical protein [Lachnospiraceae bacterium]
EFNEGTKIIRNSILEGNTELQGVILPKTICGISGQITDKKDVDIIAVKDSYAYDYAKIYKYNIINKYVNE